MGKTKNCHDNNVMALIEKTGINNISSDYTKKN